MMEVGIQALSLYHIFQYLLNEYFYTAVLIKNCICQISSKIRFIAWSFLSQELKRNTSYPKVHWTFMQQWIMSAAKKKLPFFSCNLRFQSYLKMYHSPSNIYYVQIAFFTLAVDWCLNNRYTENHFKASTTTKQHVYWKIH